MKTKIYLIVFLFMLCLGAMASPVDKERARQIATTFLNNNGSRSSELSDVSAKAGFDNVYVFTTESSFVLVAADDRVQPILGYSLDGPFDVVNMPDNKRAWIEEYGDAIRYAIDHQTKVSEEVTRQWRHLTNGYLEAGRATIVVEPLIQTRWNQNYPYNMLCPNGSVTGCVATAMAQVMKYWNYPEHGIGMHSYEHATYGTLSADFGSTYYDWTNMANTYNSSSSQAEKMAVATLMYHCGVSVDMNYSPSSSGAGSAIVAEALINYFNYSSELAYHNRSEYDDDTWISMLKADLNFNRPIWYCGTGSGGGHAFVFDGYNSDNYFHVNWGWGSYCDEYYPIDNLSPGPGGIGSGSIGIYNDGQGAIFGVRPSECTANIPTNLTYFQSGRNVALSWSLASGASSYNIYCNMNYIDNVNSTTYMDFASFGDNVYYVRSVDANGEMSLSSNSVTVTIDYQTPIVNDLSATIDNTTANLTWTAPDWCYPEIPSSIMAYGDNIFTGASIGYNDGTTKMYWGHRYPASTLNTYNNLSVYKVSFYAKETGTYQLFVYKGTSSEHPQTQALHQSLTIGFKGWCDIDLTETIQIDTTQDLWVFIYDPEARLYPATFCNYNGSEGNYISTDPNSHTYTYDGIAFLIRTYLTDGTYTYNLYRNDEAIANHIASTHYTDSDLPDGTYTYHLTTNYYGGETSPSNSVTVTVPGLVTQTVELGDTWTWWTPTVTTTLSELETALSGNGILINSQDGGFVRYENGRWNGTLLDFEPGQMYRIKTQEASTITLTGAPVNQVSINIMPGYNWFGYTGLANLTLANALNNFTPNENDQIIGQEGTATFSNGQWSGTLSSLEPGKGYIYYSTSSNTKTIRFE